MKLSIFSAVSKEPSISINYSIKKNKVSNLQQTGLIPIKNKQFTTTNERRESEIRETYPSIKPKFDQKKIENIRTQNQLTGMWCLYKQIQTLCITKYQNARVQLV